MRRPGQPLGALVLVEADLELAAGTPVMRLQPRVVLVQLLLGSMTLFRRFLGSMTLFRRFLGSMTLLLR